MRVVAVNQDMLVITSRMWQTNAVLLRGALDGEAGTRGGAGGERGLGPGGELPLARGASNAGSDASVGFEAMLVDSPYFPDELEALPGLARQSGFPIAALLATHADFDHLLGRLAFPDLALGVSHATAERLRAEPGAAQRELCEADAEHYVAREHPLGLDAAQELPVPGRLELGREELELYPAAGHTTDGMAILAPHARVLICGDYISDVEIPIISAGGSLEAYRETLARLAPLVELAERTVPGHGSPLEAERALQVLDDDVDYLDALESGDERPPFPGGRDSRRQQAIHAKNLERLAGGDGGR